MSQATIVFTKKDRELLRGLLRGTATITNGIPVQRFLGKIQAILAQDELMMEKTTINQVVYWLTNNQPVWWAIYCLLLIERPHVLTNVAFGTEVSRPVLVEMAGEGVSS